MHYEGMQKGAVAYRKREKNREEEREKEVFVQKDLSRVETEFQAEEKVI